METRKVYSPQQVAVAALLGSPLAASWLMAQNFALFGKPRERGQTLVWGAVGTVALLVVAFLLPEKFPSVVLPIACAMGIREATKHFQGPDVTAHLTAGGQKHSWWRVVAMGLAGFGIVMGVVALSALALPRAP